MSWPGRLAGHEVGGVRHQYVHAVDVMPTLLEAIGVELPAELGGVEQRPLDGASFLASLTDAAAPSARTTQYYEMLGCRAIYHDGWKAVTFHPMPGFGYDGSDPDLAFDDDRWELYHVAEDFSETRDLAAEEPERLRALVERWWEEAARNQVLPLTNRPARHGDRRHRRDRYEFGPGIGVLPTALAPNLRNRGFRITAELDLPSGGRHGRRRGPRQPRRRGRRLRPVPAGRPAALDVQLAGRPVTTVSSDDTAGRSVHGRGGVHADGAVPR